MTGGLVQVILKILASHWSISILSLLLVQDIHHSVLPNISPLTTVILTMGTIHIYICIILILMMSVLWVPALVKLWASPGNVQQFIRCLALCGWTSFLCGWHVHEKVSRVSNIAHCIITTPCEVNNHTQHYHPDHYHHHHYLYRPS